MITGTFEKVREAGSVGTKATFGAANSAVGGKQVAAGPQAGCRQSPERGGSQERVPRDEETVHLTEVCSF